MSDIMLYKKAIVAFIFKKDKKEDLGNSRLVSLTSVPREVMEKNLEIISEDKKDRKVIGSSWHGFTNGKSYITNLISFYNEMNSLLEDGRAVDVVYIGFSKTFDCLP